MAIAPRMETRVLLIGLDEGLANELGNALSHLDSKVKAQNVKDAAGVEKGQLETADCVFCPSEAVQLKSLLQTLHNRCPDLPVIAVTRHPDDFEWIRAMDAGATDYCSTPFEPVHVDWILRNNQRNSRTVAVSGS